MMVARSVRIVWAKSEKDAAKLTSEEADFLAKLSEDDHG